MESHAEKLSEVADKVDAGLSWRSVYPALHGACFPYDYAGPDSQYAQRVGATFAALRTEVDCSQHALGNVLKAAHKRNELSDIIRRAAKRIEAQ